MQFQNKQAFSLLELIFAIVIIGLIASVGIPKLMNTKSDAQIATIKKDVITISSAIQTYYLINGNLEKISDSISLNSSIWEINNKSVIFKDNEKECIIIEIIEDNEKKLNITIDGEVSTLCQKLENKGVLTTSYVLY